MTADVRHDGSEPVVDVTFGKELVFKETKTPGFVSNVIVFYFYLF